MLYPPPLLNICSFFSHLELGLLICGLSWLKDDGREVYACNSLYFQSKHSLVIDGQKLPHKLLIFQVDVNRNNQ